MVFLEPVCKGTQRNRAVAGRRMRGQGKVFVCFDFVLRFSEFSPGLPSPSFPQELTPKAIVDGQIKYAIQGHTSTQEYTGVTRSVSVHTCICGCAFLIPVNRNGLKSVTPQ